MPTLPEALFLATELESPLGTVISSEVDRRAVAELRRLHAHIEMLESDPASHFCHRFAILMESMLLTNDVNGYWDVAHALLDEYNSARNKWMEAQGQPYVSGFGKD